VLLFPYSPSINLVNHPDRTLGQKANVAIRWSSQLNKHEWLELNASALMHQNESSLVMEYYALTDIAKGEELLLDYGSAWESAWEQHVDDWNRRKEQYSAANSESTNSSFLVHMDDYVSAFNYSKQCDKTMAKDQVYHCIFKPPSWIEVRCWIHPVRVRISDESDEKVEIRWLPQKAIDDPNTISLDVTHPCDVLSSHTDDTFRVRLHYEKKWKKKTVQTIVRVLFGVPREAIFMVDHRYTNNQLLRAAFRHEIQLPETMVPSAWKDLEPEPDTKCGLYMAASAIENSGLGMYSAVPIAKDSRIFYGDVVVQVEDMELNTKLRHWSQKDFDYEENDWLLSNYYWNSRNSMGNYDAVSVQSVIPGLGV
jgi:hypothetical protein